MKNWNVEKMKIQNFFYRIRFFHLDAFWYDVRYWKPSPGSILNIFNNGLIISHDMSSIFNKMWASCKLRLKSWNSNFFFKIQKSMSRLKIFKNRYWEMKDHVLKMFSRCYHISKKTFIFEEIFDFFLQVFRCIFMHNLLRNL